MSNKFFSPILILIYLISPFGNAWGIDIPAADNLMELSSEYRPVALRGIKIDTHDPLSFEFIVDRGDAHLYNQPLNDVTTKLVKYFLCALTIPDEDLWVNLSPYEQERIIDENFGRTGMGQDMLEADYLLKQLSSSLTHPETELGTKFWEQLYSKIYDFSGVKNTDINIFNKVWIVPDKVHIYKNHNSAFILDAKMKVLMEEDYLALKKSNQIQKNTNKINRMSSLIGKDIIIPAIEKEINTGKNFSQLRQMYYALILAAWYKKSFSLTPFYQNYVRQQKIKGIDTADRDFKNTLYNHYMRSFGQGIYNYIKEDYDQSSRSIIPRKYFSGGMQFLNFDLRGKKAFEILNLEKSKDQTSDFAIASYKVEAMHGDNLGNIQTIKDYVAHQINANYSYSTNRYDFKKAILKEGGKIITGHGELWMKKDGILVFIDDRLTNSFTDFDGWAIYANTIEGAIYEEEFLRSLAQFALEQKIATYEEIAFQHQLGEKLLEWKDKNPLEFAQLEKQSRSKAGKEKMKYKEEKQKSTMKPPNVTNLSHFRLNDDTFNLLKEGAGEKIANLIKELKMPLSSVVVDIILNHSETLNLIAVKNFLQIFKQPHLSVFSRELVDYSYENFDFNSLLKWVKHPTLATLQGFAGAFFTAEALQYNAQKLFAMDIKIHHLPTPLIINLNQSIKEQRFLTLKEGSFSADYLYKKGGEIPKENALAYIWKLNTHQMQTNWTEFQEGLENFTLPGEISAINQNAGISDQIQYLMTVIQPDQSSYSRQAIITQAHKEIGAIKEKILKINPAIDPIRIEQKVNFNILVMNHPSQPFISDTPDSRAEVHDKLFKPWTQKTEKVTLKYIKKESELIDRRIKKLTNLMGLQRIFPSIRKETADFVSQLIIHWFAHQNLLKDQNPLTFLESSKQLFGQPYLRDSFIETFYDKLTDSQGNTTIIPKKNLISRSGEADQIVRHWKNILAADQNTMASIAAHPSERIPLAELSQPQRAKKLIDIRNGRGHHDIVIEGDYVIKTDHAQIAEAEKGGIDFNKEYIDWNISTAEEYPEDKQPITNNEKKSISANMQADADKNVFSNMFSAEGYAPVHIKTIDLPIKSIPLFLEGRK